MTQQEEVENIIYTDFIGTKIEINTYAQEWLRHYSNYLMPINPERLYAENGIIKCAIMFISKTQQSYPDFKNKFEANEIDKILNYYYLLVMKKERLCLDDYFFINQFIYKYLHVTGMDKIDTEKRNLGKTVLRTR